MVERIIREHSADVTRVLASWLYTPDRHEDALDCCSRAAQITFEKYLAGVITPEDDADTLVGYFYNCAKNIAREENARYLRHKRLTDENLSEISENLFQDKDYICDVLEVIETVFAIVGNHLGEREIRILRLHYCDGYTFKEIAEDLDLTAANVRKIHERTIKRIRDLLSRFRGPDGPGGGRRTIERAKSKNSRPERGSGTIQNRNNIKSSRENNSDIQLSIIEQLMTLYGTICRDLYLDMFDYGSLVRQIEKLQVYSDDLINSIELLSIILSYLKIEDKDLHSDNSRWIQ